MNKSASQGGSFPRQLKGLLPILLLLALLGAMCALSPMYRTSTGVMGFLQRAAPLMILTCGQAFVLISGGFDLSAGALITLGVIAGALIGNGDPSMTWAAIAATFAIGALVGVVNGAIVAWFRVPSIIATLGSLLAVKGIAMAWSGGAPSGELPDNFRYFGRGVVHDVPLLGSVPCAVVILVVFVAVCFWLLHRTNFGRLTFMLGDNPMAAHLAGASVHRLRICAFLVSAISAATAGIMLGGFSGVSVDVGTGYELQAIAGAVVGGIALLGGKGSILGAAIGALTLYALFTVLNLVGFPEPMRVAVQGLILIAAVALSTGGAKRSA